MSWIFLVAAYFIGSAEPSIFDEPYNWPRIGFTALLVTLAAVIYLVKGDE